MTSFANGMVFEGLMSDIEKMHMSHAHDSEIVNEQKSNARNFAEKWALRKALAQFDPNHPLLTDDALRKSIHKEANRVYDQKNSTWKDVGEAGANFQYSYTPPATDTSLAQRAAKLEEENIQNYVEKHALRKALGSIDNRHPLLWPKPEESPLIASLRRAGLMAYTFSKSYEAVADAAKTFTYPESITRPPKESNLEAYGGEMEALEERLAYLRNPTFQEAARRLQEQAQRAPK